MLRRSKLRWIPLKENGVRNESKASRKLKVVYGYRPNSQSMYHRKSRDQLD